MKGLVFKFASGDSEGNNVWLINVITITSLLKYNTDPKECSLEREFM
jgi:hypothetical protein